MKKLLRIKNSYRFPYNIWYFIKYFGEDVVCAWDRVTKGYSKDMFWSWDLTQAVLIQAAANQMLENDIGYPVELQQEFGDELAVEIWSAVLEDIAHGFNAYEELFLPIYDLYDIGEMDLYEAESVRLQEEFEWAMYLYVTYYGNFWD